MYINCFVLCKEMVKIALFEFMMIAWKKKTETGKSKIPRNVNKYEYCFGSASSGVLMFRAMHKLDKFFSKTFSVHLWNETEISQPWLGVL